MLTLKFLRKIGKILRGGANTREIMLGFLLGIIWGMIPGFNFTQFIMLFLVLLLNANLGFMFMGLLVGTLACYGLSTLTFELGYVIISSLQGLFTNLHNTALVAWMGLDSYCLVGGFPIALVLGIAVGTFLGKTVEAARERIFKLEESDKMQELNKKTWIKILLFIAFGGKLPNREEQEENKHPVFRPMGLGLIIFSIVLIAILEFFLLESIMKSQFEKHLTRANGAEVNVAELSFSMKEGHLSMKGVEFTDSSDLSKNAFQIGDLELDLKMSDLLKSRAAVELLKIDLVEFGTTRKVPGKDYQGAEDEQEEIEPAEEEKEGEFDLNKYLNNSGQLKEYYKKVKDYFDQQEESAEAVSEDKPLKVTKLELREQAKKLGYLNLRARELYQKAPAWLIINTEVTNIKLGENNFSLKIKDLCSHPAINGKAIIADLTDNSAITANAILNVNQVNADHDLTINIADLERKEAIDLGEDTAVVLKNGKMSFDLDGQFSRDSFNLPFFLKIKDLTVDVRPGKKILGLDEENAEEILNAMESIDVEGNFTGNWDKPKLVIDYDKLLKRVKEAALEAGKKVLQEKVDEKKKEVEDKIRKKTDDKLDKVKEKLDDKLKGLFGN